MATRRSITPASTRRLTRRRQVAGDTCDCTSPTRGWYSEASSLELVEDAQIGAVNDDIDSIIVYVNYAMTIAHVSVMEAFYQNQADIWKHSPRQLAYDSPSQTQRRKVHVRHRRRGQHAQHRPDPDRRPEAARVPRLRLVRRRGAPGRRAAPRAQHRARRRARRAQSPRDARDGGTGIAHTRWATHGAPAVHNAHPHFSQAARDRASRWCTTASSRTTTSCAPKLKARGYVFDSQTDTEVIAHLVAPPLRRRSARRGAARVADACAAPTRSRCSAATSRIAWSARAHGSPLVLGVGRRRDTSSPPTRWRWPASPTASSTSRRATSSTCSSASTGSARRSRRPTLRAACRREVRTVQAHTGAAELGPVPPLHAEGDLRAAARDRRHARRACRRITPELFGDGAYSVFKEVDSVLILACGTSYYAGLTAKYWLEAIARIPTQVEIASEYRYRDSVPNPKHAGRHDHARAARPPTRWPR